MCVHFLNDFMCWITWILLQRLLLQMPLISTHVRRWSHLDPKAALREGKEGDRSQEHRYFSVFCSAL